MKRIASIIIGFCLLAPNVAASTEKCISAWSASFDKADTELMTTIDQLSKSNKNTSDLTAALPNIMRIYRRQLKLICKAAEVKTSITESEKIPLAENDKIIKLLEVGNEEVKISDLEIRYGSLNDCAQIKTGDNNELLKLWTTCDMHAEYKIKQLQNTLPEIMRKSSNRKQMGFLSFKLMDLQKRLNEFMFDSLVPFSNKFLKIIDSIKCVSKKCD